MKRKDVLKSVPLKRIFVEDRNLPFLTLDNPYFESRLDALDKMFGCVEAFDVFCETLEGFENEIIYLNYHKGVETKILNHLCTLMWTSRAEASNKIQQVFCNVDDSNIRHPFTITPEDDTAYISIHISPFNLARFFRPELFCGYNSTEEFVGWFTQDKHLITSKGFIDKILMRKFGPYVYDYMRIMMASTCRVLADKFNIADRVRSIDFNEILIEVGGNMGFSLNELKECIKSIPVIGEFFTVDIFECYTIDGTDGYIRNYYSDDRYEIYGVDDSIFAQVAQYIHCDPIIEDDLVFHDYKTDKLVRFLEPIKNPLIKNYMDYDDDEIKRLKINDYRINDYRPY